MVNNYNIAEQISIYRKNNEIDKAVQEARRGIREFPESNFFYKILGDLLWIKEDRIEAGKAYIGFLTKINTDIQYVKNFVKFWRKFTNKASEEEKKLIYDNIVEEFNKNTFSLELKRELGEILYNTFPAENELFQGFEKKGSTISKWLKKQEEEKQTWNIYRMLFWEKKYGTHTAFTTQCDKYLVSVMEKYELHGLALDLIKKVLNYDSDEVAVRTLFRLCRKTDDYAEADRYMEAHPEIEERKGFNIQYELVYYYLKKQDELKLMSTLKNIRQGTTSSIPISKTLQNFYLMLGMIDEAEEMRRHIEQLRDKYKGYERKSAKGIKGVEEERETDDVFWDTIKDMVSEQEHNRQLIAIKDLLKGFSHELGQPSTNIRYGIQLYQMKMQRNLDTKEELKELLHNILQQTVRMKKLLDRFVPIVSGKNVNSEFNCVEQIKNVFADMQMRLESLGIDYMITGIDSFVLRGDYIQFQQVFYNLISNAADELRNTDGIKKIEVVCKIIKNCLHISFRDNGGGISEENINKIFNPFYSTKDDNEKADGGEGLGLYIVWNILKMYGGKIKVNPLYKHGAEFLIVIPEGGEKNV